MFEGTRFLLRALPHLPRFMSYKPGGSTALAELLEERAAEQGDRPFVLFEEQRVSYAQMNARANRVAHWGRELGLERGDVVALLMENRPEYLATWMGLAKLGVVSALVNTNLRGEALQHALVTSKARRIVLGAECAEAFASTPGSGEPGLDVWLSGEPGATLDAAALPSGAHELEAALEGQPGDDPDPAVRAGHAARDDLFYIYTSGTTGHPKAARFSHLRFVSGGDLGAWMLELGPDDVHYCALPLYHTAGGVMQVGSTLFAGATLALRRRFSASAFWDDVRKYEATAFQYIGEFCRYLVNQPPHPNDGDHRVRVAIGNGLRPDIWQEFRERFQIPRILEFYGATEGNVGLINFENKVGSVGRYPSRLLGRLMSNAKIVRFDVESETHARDDDGFCIECDDDEAGELIGRIPGSPDVSSGRFEGYTSEEATEKKILRNVFEQDDAWFRTGDLLRRDAEGFHYFVDRIGDTFRWKGENVSTQEVAEVLSGFPGLDMINVYGVSVPGADGRAGMLAFVPTSERDFDGPAFHAFVRERLPAYAMPLFVRVLGEPELTGTFKLRKVSLQQEGFDPARVSDPLWFRDDAADSYVPLTRELHDEIVAGRRRV